MESKTFSQFLSATISPAVALVSAPRTIPSLNKHPTIVVPVLVAFGKGSPFSAMKLFLPPRVNIIIGYMDRYCQSPKLV